MKLRSRMGIKVRVVTGLYLYALEKIREKSNLKGEVKISEALRIISVLFHVPKTKFKAKKKGFNICAFDVLKELEDAGYLRIHPFNKVVLIEDGGENEEAS